MPIPIIDLNGFFNSAETVKKSIASELDTACRDTGFFAITGHGVDEKVMSRARRTSVDIANCGTKP